MFSRYAGNASRPVRKLASTSSFLQRSATPSSFSSSLSIPCSRSLSTTAARLSSTTSTSSHSASGSSKSARLAWASLPFLAALTYYSINHDTIAAEADPYASRRTQPSGQKLISFQEVQKHNKKDDCWVIVQGQVYDVTEFLPNHPGGARVIVKNGGQDATHVYMPIHPPGTIENSLDPSKSLGAIDPLTLPTKAKELTPDQKRVEEARKNLPSLGSMINLNDFEILAEKVLSTEAWAYYSSAGDDEVTKQENEDAFKRYFFRPRILRDVSPGLVDISTTILGSPSSAPFFIAPAAMARLGHPDGEMNLTKGAGTEGIIQAISANASCSLDEIIAAKVSPSQPLFYQLYINWDRSKSEAIVDQVDKQYGCKAIFVTVDSAATGNRERDQRAKGDFDDDTSKAGKGVAHAISGYQAADMTWNDIKWIKARSKLPVVIKGIQSVPDAKLAYQAGVQGIVISNHGGRSLDFSPAPIDILYEIRQEHPELLDDPHFDVIIDGGIRRGTDVLKAVCLGATAVGLGRTFLYAQSCYGEAGVRKAIQILQKEITTDLRLLGCTKLSQLGPEYIRRKPLVQY